jgi:integrase
MPVRKRNGIWQVDFQIRGVRYKRSVKEATSKQQAQLVEARMRQEVFDGRYGREGGSTLFNDFVSEVFLPWSKENKSSYVTDEVFCRAASDFFQGKKFRDITPLLIEKFKKSRNITQHGTTRKAASINRELACLSKIFSLAVDYDYSAQNPCSKVKRLKVDNARGRYLMDGEEEMLFAALVENYAWLRPIVELGLHTGMRRGEILKLEMSNVDLQKGWINLRPDQTKEKKAKLIPLNSLTRRALESMYDETARRVFPYTVGQIEKAFASAVKRAELVDFHFHDLRRTVATRLNSMGVDIITLAALLGHAPPKITGVLMPEMTRIYARPTTEMLRRAMNLLGEWKEIEGKVLQFGVK